MHRTVQRLLALFFAVLLGTSPAFTAADDISRLYNFTSGTTIQSSQVNGEFNQLVTTMNSKFGRGIANTLSGNNTFSGANTFSGITTFSSATTPIKTDKVDEYTPAAGVTVDSVLLKDGGGTFTSAVTLPASNPATLNQAARAQYVHLVARGLLAGLTMSNNGSDANNDIDISEGQAVDSTSVDLITLAAITKRTDAAWTVGTGNGCMDTGAKPSSATLHIFAIKRSDTGVTDSLCSISATTPTMPTNYTYKRRIGSVRTDGSSNIIAFKQYGDQFWFVTPPTLDVDVTNQSTSSVTRTLTVPNGLQLEAILNVYISSTSANTAVYFRSLDMTDAAPSITASPLANMIAPTDTSTRSVGGQIRVITNTSGQIGTRSNLAGTTVRISTQGWIDTRGRFD